LQNGQPILGDISLTHQREASHEHLEKKSIRVVIPVKLVLVKTGNGNPEPVPEKARSRREKPGSPDQVQDGLGWSLSDGDQGGMTNLKTTNLDLRTLRILGNPKMIVGFLQS
jgi:hypothetical protein